MKHKEISELPVAELKKKKTALVQDLFDARMKNNLGQLGNPLEIRKLRRNVARVNTAMAQKSAR